MNSAPRQAEPPPLPVLEQQITDAQRRWAFATNPDERERQRLECERLKRHRESIASGRRG